MDEEKKMPVNSEDSEEEWTPGGGPWKTKEEWEAFVDSVPCGPEYRRILQSMPTYGIFRMGSSVEGREDYQQAVSKPIDIVDLLQALEELEEEGAEAVRITVNEFGEVLMEDRDDSETLYVFGEDDED